MDRTEGVDPSRDEYYGGVLMRIFDELKGFKFKPTFGRFGIEIETEVPKKSDYPSGFLVPHVFHNKEGWIFPNLPSWIGHIDLSLRNYGVEYVLSEPMDYDQTMVALDEFGRETKKIPFIKSAPGTSVHVHLNALPETFLTLANFLTLFTLFENLLVEFSGETRRSNLFALPNRCAETTYWNICELFKSIDRGSTDGVFFHEEIVKYAVLNLARLKSFGSIEIRCFRGTTDVQEIKDWVSILNNLMEYSRVPGLTPKGVIAEFNKNSEEMFSEIFKDYAGVLRSIPEFDNLIVRNLWYAGCIAMAVQDWGGINTKISSRRNEFEEKKSSKKKFDLGQPGMVYDDFEATGWQTIQLTLEAENEDM